MSLKNVVKRMIAAVAVAILASMTCTPAKAQYTWGSTGGGGSGTWDTSTLNWFRSGSAVAWPVSGTSAVFAGSSGSVAISGSVTAPAITFSTTGYAVTGGQLDIGSGTGAVSVAANASSSIASPISGGGLTKSGSGTLTLGDANTYLGKTAITTGTVVVSSIKNADGTASGLGAPVSSANGTIVFGTSFSTGALVYNGAGDTTDRIIDISASGAFHGAGAVIEMAGSGTLNFTNPTFQTGVTYQRYLTLQGSTAGIGVLNATIGLNSGGITFTKAGSGTWILTGTMGVASIYNTPHQILGGTLQIGSGGTTGAWTDNGVLNLASGATLVFNRSDSYGYSESGPIFNASLTSTSTGAGTVVVRSGYLRVDTGTNYSGTWQIDTSGTLQAGFGNGAGIGSATRLGPGLITNNGALVFRSGNPAVQFRQGTTFGTITGSGNVTINPTIVNPAAYVFNAANTYSGTTFITSGTLRAEGNAGALGTGTGAGAVTVNGGGLQLAGTTGLNFGRNTLMTSSATFTTDAMTAGSAGVTHTLGTLAIGAQTLTVAGGTNVTSGTAGLTFGNATMTGAASFIVNRPAGGGTTLLTVNNVDNGANLLTVGGAGNTAINGVLGSGAVKSGGLTKTGSGQLTLSAANAYTGATTVSQGSLRLNGSIAASSSLSVAAAGTLLGTGTVNGLAAITGTHSPGEIVGLQTFNNNLSYAAGSAVNWNLIASATSGTAVANQVAVPNGNLTFSGSTSLNLAFNDPSSSVDWSNPFWDSNRSWLFYDLTSGTTTGVSNFSIKLGAWLDSTGTPFATARVGSSFSITQTGSDLFVTYYVPEPTQMVFVAGLGAILGAWRLRKLRQSNRCSDATAC